MHLLRRITHPSRRTLASVPREMRETSRDIIREHVHAQHAAYEHARNTESPRPVEELAVSPDRAAELLGVSRDFFDKHIKHQIPVTYVGRRIIIPVAGLHGWLEKNSTTP